MPRPASRVPFAQECGRARSIINQAQKQLRPPRHLAGLDQPRSLPSPSPLQLQDARAAYWCERAVAALKQAEESWDDPALPE